jgi:hypothetical protein
VTFDFELIRLVDRHHGQAPVQRIHRIVCPGQFLLRDAQFVRRCLPFVQGDDRG